MITITFENLPFSANNIKINQDQGIVYTIASDNAATVTSNTSPEPLTQVKS